MFKQYADIYYINKKTQKINSSLPSSRLHSGESYWEELQRLRQSARVYSDSLVHFVSKYWVDLAANLGGSRSTHCMKDQNAHYWDKTTCIY